MSHLSSYAKVHTVGHREVKDILQSGPVVVEEKIDGSQFSMARIDGQLVCRSKGKELVIGAPEKMFINAMATAAALPLRDGWVYRCEYLQRPQHNTLAYSRVPNKYLILFDVMYGCEMYLNPTARYNEACRLGLECVPVFHEGLIPSAKGDGEYALKFLQQFLDRDSILGGCKIEGVVIKNYERCTSDGKLMTAKLVSEAFKEKHQRQWKLDNPTPTDVAQHIISSLRTEARWAKAVQHLREAGVLTDTPADIGPLIREIQRDTLEEETACITEALFKHFWPKIQRGITAGFPEWYKEYLIEYLIKHG